MPDDSGADWAYLREQRLEEQISDIINIVVREKPTDACARCSELFAARSTTGAPATRHVTSSWRTATWLRSLGIEEICANALLAPHYAGRHTADDLADDELAYVRSLHSEAEVRTLLSSGSGVLDRLSRAVWAGVESLRSTGAQTGAELHAKFVQDGVGFTLSYGGLDTFWRGLEALVGAPNPKLAESIEREHTACADSQLPFQSANYLTKTTSHTEYLFVFEPDAGLKTLGIDEWPSEAAGAGDEGAPHRRRARTLAEFEPAIAAINAKLVANGTALFLPAEAACARLCARAHLTSQPPRAPHTHRPARAPPTPPRPSAAPSPLRRSLSPPPLPFPSTAPSPLRCSLACSTLCPLCPSRHRPSVRQV